MGLARGLRTKDGGPPSGPDHELTLSNGPHATGIVDRISEGPVPLPAVDGGPVAWSQQMDGFRLVMGTPMDALQQDFSVGTWTVMLKISMRI